MTTSIERLIAPNIDAHVARGARVVEIQSSHQDAHVQHFVKLILG